MLPRSSVFDLYGMSLKKKVEYFKKGSISFEDLQGVKLNDKQKRQIDHTLNDRTDHIDEKGIRNFLRLFRLAGRAEDGLQPCVVVVRI